MKERGPQYVGMEVCILCGPMRPVDSYRMKKLDEIKGYSIEEADESFSRGK